MAERRRRGATRKRPLSQRLGRSRWRTLLGVLLLLAMPVGGWLFLRWEPFLLPVRVVEVEGELHHHSSALLSQTLTERLDGGILTANLVELKRAAESLAWVGHASLRRVWPDRLLVLVEEHRPIARWNDDGLVTAEGVVFRPRAATLPAGLPVLVGEEARAAELASRYQDWRDRLMLVGHLIQTLAVDPRGDWRVELVMGTELRLGSEQVEERLARFIANAPQLEAVGQLLVVDLRYSNGFAVRWADERQAQVRANSGRPEWPDNRG
ncbi:MULTISPECIES: cell division protein FtsQ/DivIB [Marichromatium]|uniref:Cell division protein FtsQ n=1 Tax=Marichromatium gracile TaxID=1048 RepID=A0A4R4AG49_MARGR|nr:MULTISPECIES: cell division protein FtsQ/DivIB [Marichromatium]TCW38208.1 cell division protein FtsQ [Marichromatium gracile]